jgi:uncharacterized protein YcbX
MLRVASLHEYPVKSCRGVDVAELRLDEKGPVHDRRFMIVDEGGRFVTQREHPELCLVAPRLTESELVLEAPGLGRLRVALGGGFEPLPVTVWRYSSPADDLGEEAARWLSSYLGRAARLVRFREEGFRAASASHSPPGSSAGRFSDGYPVLLATLASLADLNARMSEALPMSRFRPNVVVEGGQAWEEDSWRELRIGEVSLLNAKPCERCVVTTIDPETGRAGKEPLATLARFRRREGAVHFAVNLVHRGPGVVRVGDPVEIQP